MQKWVLVGAAVVVALGLVCVTRPVRADDESDRKSLIYEIDGLLRDAADYLRNAGTSTSTSEVDSARDRTSRVRDKLSSLDRAKGDDDKARSYVSRYPRYLEDFDRASQSLKAQKADQRSIADVPRRCADLDKQLTEQAERFEREKDGERIEELRRLALDSGGKAEDWWRDADKQRDAMSRRADETRRFSVSDGEWSRVTSALQDAAVRSLELWMRDFAELERSCKDLRQRDRHPVVDRALRALEGTSKGKDQIYQQLDEKLKRAESNFKDLFGDSSSSKVADARGTMDEIKSLLDRLKESTGLDKKANLIISTWPDYVTAFTPAALALAGLKDAEHELDDVPYKCSVAARELQDKMDAYASNKDPDGLHVVPPEADALGERYTRALSTVDAARSTRDHLVQDVAAFQPRDDRWQPLRRQMKETADQLYAYWDQHREVAHRSCDELAKGRHNPAVEKFMEALGAKAQSDLKDFQDLVAAWERDARDIYMLDCKDMQHLWDAWCTVEFEPNEAPEDSVVLQETASIIDTELAKIGGVLVRLGPLRATAAQLAKKDKYRSTIEKIQKDVFDKQEPRLQKLQRQGGDWRGSNNPAFAFTTNYGKQAHDRMNRQKGCNVYDQEGYPLSTRGRPDCVKVEGKGKCWVYEFKPQDWVGTDPSPPYAEGVARFYTDHMRAGTTPESKLGGSGFQALVESNCRVDPSKDKKDDTIRFGHDIVPYDRCEHRYECVRE
jgi:hypothetical protein